MIKKILLIAVLLIEFAFLFQWVSCRNFPDRFHFSSHDVGLRLQDAIHTDKNQSVQITRFYHNKVSLGLNDTVSRYVLFFDTRFLVVFISIVGIFGLILGYFGIFSLRQKQRVKIAIVMMTIIIPLFEIFFSQLFPFIFRLILLGFLYIPISEYGIWYVLTNFHKKKYIMEWIVFFLCIMSIWWFFILKIEIVYLCSAV